MTTEEERLDICRYVAGQVHIATGQDCYDAIERLTRPALDLAKVADFVHSQMYPRLPEPSPYKRGVLDRYQDTRHSYAARCRARRH